MKNKWNLKCKRYVDCDLKETYTVAVFNEEEDAKLCAKFFNEYAEQTGSSNWYSVESDVDFFANEDDDDWDKEEESYWKEQDDE